MLMRMHQLVGGPFCSQMLATTRYGEFTIYLYSAETS